MGGKVVGGGSFKGWSRRRGPCSIGRAAVEMRGAVLSDVEGAGGKPGVHGGAGDGGEAIN